MNPNISYICNFIVLKRPGVDNFLKEISKCYEICVSTAAEAVFANKVVKFLDPKGDLISKVFSTDDLGRKLDSVVMIDNSVECFSLQMGNGCYIKPYINDANDIELMDLFSLLKKISKKDDVRQAIRELTELPDLFDSYIKSYESIRFALSPFFFVN